MRWTRRLVEAAAAGAQIGDELPYREAERGLLVGGQLGVVAIEPQAALVGRQTALLVERAQELRVGEIHPSRLAARDLGVDLCLAGLPLPGPLPRVGGVDEHLGAQDHGAVFRERDLDDGALLKVRCLADGRGIGYRFAG